MKTSKLPARALRAVIWTVLFLAAYGPLTFHYALTAPITLDENEGLERIERSPLDLSLPYDYWTAIDHPAVFRWINRAVLRVTGVEIGTIPTVDRSQSPRWNIDHGRAAPRRPVMVLRCASATALVMAWLLLFYLSRLALGAWPWGFLVVAPLALPRHLAQAAGGYILTDAYLAFFLALVVLVWVRLHVFGAPMRYRNVAMMGILIGAAVSTKLNAGLLLPAYAIYVALIVRGRAFWVRFLMFAAAAWGTFIILNPVMWQAFVPGHGGPLWWAHVVSDILTHRWRVIEMHKNLLGEYTIRQRLGFFLPYWYLLPAFVVLLAWARREKWFLPVTLWAGFLLVGTALTANVPLMRYRLPSDMAAAVATMLAAVSTAQRLYHRDTTLKALLGLKDR
jgi:hypothetical protein